jgi:hypothetical protein
MILNESQLNFQAMADTEIPRPEEQQSMQKNTADHF